MEKLCCNRYCRLADMNIGPVFVTKLFSKFVDAGRIAHLNLSLNLIGDSGAVAISQVLSKSQSLVSLNLASNGLGKVGFICLFNAITINQSLITLNLSTIEGINRNRISKRVYPAFRHMLLNSEFLLNLDLSGVSLGNYGI